MSPSARAQSLASSPLTDPSGNPGDEGRAGGAVIESDSEPEGRRLTRQKKGKGQAIELSSELSDDEDGAPLRLRKRFSRIKSGRQGRRERKLNADGRHEVIGGAEGSSTTQNGEEESG